MAAEKALGIRRAKLRQRDEVRRPELSCGSSVPELRVGPGRLRAAQAIVIAATAARRGGCAAKQNAWPA